MWRLTESLHPLDTEPYDLVRRRFRRNAGRTQSICRRKTVNARQKPGDNNTYHETRRRKFQYLLKSKLNRERASIRSKARTAESEEMRNAECGMQIESKLLWSSIHHSAFIVHHFFFASLR
jgi:hypothetical protein